MVMVVVENGGQSEVIDMTPVQLATRLSKESGVSGGKPLTFETEGVTIFDYGYVRFASSIPAEALRAAFRSLNNRCTRCGGGGIYYWGTIVNGVPSFSGTCYRCNGCGIDPDARKATPAEVAPVVEPEQKDEAPAVVNHMTGNLPEGTYTIEDEDGHFTFRVKIADSGYMEGKTVVEYLYGPDNGLNFIGFAFMDDGRVKVWKRFKESGKLVERANQIAGIQDAEAAGMAYALRSTRCRRCNRELTVPASIHRGYGPDCAAKVGL